MGLYQIQTEDILPWISTDSSCSKLLPCPRPHTPSLFPTLEGAGLRELFRDLTDMLKVLHNESMSAKAEQYYLEGYKAVVVFFKLIIKFNIGNRK